MRLIRENLVEHMKDFGLHMIGKGLVNSTFDESGWNPYNHSMAIVHIAHGTELIIKARIAEQHPLLIFKSIPKSTSVDNELGMLELLEHGQSITYSELPERLWACTGYKIKNLALYNEFGKLRNQILHLAVPKINLAEKSLNFGYVTLEEMIYDWWGATLFEYAAEYDSAYFEYVFEILDNYDIETNYTIDENYGLTKKADKNTKDA